MEGSRFDALARSFAHPGSRRRLLAGFAASTLGLVGLGGAEAAVCRAVGSVCREDANCCNGS